MSHWEAKQNLDSAIDWADAPPPTAADYRDALLQVVRDLNRLCRTPYPGTDPGPLCCDLVALATRAARLVEGFGLELREDGEEEPPAPEPSYLRVIEGN